MTTPGEHDRPRRRADVEGSRGHHDRYAVSSTLGGDLSSIIAIAREIVDLGEDVFFDSRDIKPQVLAEGLVVRLSALLDRIPDSFKDDHPEIPWHQVEGMRNKMAHRYWETDFDLVWAVLERDIPDLGARLLPHLKADEAGRGDLD